MLNLLPRLPEYLCIAFAYVAIAFTMLAVADETCRNLKKLYVKVTTRR